MSEYEWREGVPDGGVLIEDGRPKYWTKQEGGKVWHARVVTPEDAAWLEKRLDEERAQTLEAQAERDASREDAGVYCEQRDEAERVADRALEQVKSYRKVLERIAAIAEADGMIERLAHRALWPKG